MFQERLRPSASAGTAGNAKPLPTLLSFASPQSPSSTKGRGGGLRSSPSKKIQIQIAEGGTTPTSARGADGNMNGDEQYNQTMYTARGTSTPKKKASVKFENDRLRRTSQLPGKKFALLLQTPDTKPVPPAPEPTPALGQDLMLADERQLEFATAVLSPSLLADWKDIDVGMGNMTPSGSSASSKSNHAVQHNAFKKTLDDDDARLSPNIEDEDEGVGVEQAEDAERERMAHQISRLSTHVNSTSSLMEVPFDLPEQPRDASRMKPTAGGADDAAGIAPINRTISHKRSSLKRDFGSPMSRSVSKKKRVSFCSLELPPEHIVESQNVNVNRPRANAHGRNSSLYGDDLGRSLSDFATAGSSKKTSFISSDAGDRDQDADHSNEDNILDEEVLRKSPDLSRISGIDRDGETFLFEDEEGEPYAPIDGEEHGDQDNNNCNSSSSSCTEVHMDMHKYSTAAQDRLQQRVNHLVKTLSTASSVVIDEERDDAETVNKTNTRTSTAQNANARSASASKKASRLRAPTKVPDFVSTQMSRASQQDLACTLQLLNALEKKLENIDKTSTSSISSGDHKDVEVDDNMKNMSFDEEDFGLHFEEIAPLPSMIEKVMDGDGDEDAQSARSSPYDAMVGVDEIHLVAPRNTRASGFLDAPEKQLQGGQSTQSQSESLLPSAAKQAQSQLEKDQADVDEHVLKPGIFTLADDLLLKQGMLEQGLVPPRLSDAQLDLEEEWRLDFERATLDDRFLLEESQELDFNRVLRLSRAGLSKDLERDLAAVQELEEELRNNSTTNVGGTRSILALDDGSEKKEKADFQKSLGLPGGEVTIKSTSGGLLLPSCTTTEPITNARLNAKSMTSKNGSAVPDYRCFAGTQILESGDDSCGGRGNRSQSLSRTMSGKQYLEEQALATLEEKMTSSSSCGGSIMGMGATLSSGVGNFGVDTPSRKRTSLAGMRPPADLRGLSLSAQKSSRSKSPPPDALRRQVFSCDHKRGREVSGVSSATSNRDESEDEGVEDEPPIGGVSTQIPTMVLHRTSSGASFVEDKQEIAPESFKEDVSLKQVAPSADIVAPTPGPVTTSTTVSNPTKIVMDKSSLTSMLQNAQRSNHLKHLVVAPPSTGIPRVSLVPPVKRTLLQWHPQLLSTGKVSAPIGRGRTLGVASAARARGREEMTEWLPEKCNLVEQDEIEVGTTCVAKSLCATPLFPAPIFSKTLKIPLGGMLKNKTEMKKATQDTDVTSKTNIKNINNIKQENAGATTTSKQYKQATARESTIMAATAPLDIPSSSMDATSTTETTTSTKTTIATGRRSLPTSPSKFEPLARKVSPFVVCQPLQIHPPTTAPRFLGQSKPIVWHRMPMVPPTINLNVQARGGPPTTRTFLTTAKPQEAHQHCTVLGQPTPVATTKAGEQEANKSVATAGVDDPTCIDLAAAASTIRTKSSTSSLLGGTTSMLPPPTLLEDKEEDDEEQEHDRKDDVLQLEQEDEHELATFRALDTSSPPTVKKETPTLKRGRSSPPLSRVASAKLGVPAHLVRSTSNQTMTPASEVLKQCGVAGLGDHVVDNGDELTATSGTNKKRCRSRTTAHDVKNYVNHPLKEDQDDESLSQDQPPPLTKSVSRTSTNKSVSVVRRPPSAHRRAPSLRSDAVVKSVVSQRRQASNCTKAANGNGRVGSLSASRERSVAAEEESQSCQDLPGTSRYAEQKVFDDEQHDHQAEGQVFDQLQDQVAVVDMKHVHSLLRTKVKRRTSPSGGCMISSEQDEDNEQDDGSFYTARGQPANATGHPWSPEQDMNNSPCAEDEAVDQPRRLVVGKVQVPVFGAGGDTVQHLEGNDVRFEKMPKRPQQPRQQQEELFDENLINSVVQELEEKRDDPMNADESFGPEHLLQHLSPNTTGKAKNACASAANKKTNQNEHASGTNANPKLTASSSLVVLPSPQQPLKLVNQNKDHQGEMKAKAIKISENCMQLWRQRQQDGIQILPMKATTTSASANSDNTRPASSPRTGRIVKPAHLPMAGKGNGGAGLEVTGVQVSTYTGASTAPAPPPHKIMASPGIGVSLVSPVVSQHAVSTWATSTQLIAGGPRKLNSMARQVWEQPMAPGAFFPSQPPLNDCRTDPKKVHRMRSAHA
ncbi:unnamed protein product [Amoebophrya sp. A25]|nr:unnamed protein product [Amoebophrya sp. A25]|eukprot:GSA25T00023204001.1